MSGPLLMDRIDALSAALDAKEPGWWRHWGVEDDGDWFGFCFALRAHISRRQMGAESRVTPA